MSTPTPLDGNVAAGPLRLFFSVDLTAAIGQCDGCGRLAPLATSVAYVDAPGLVVRCTGCDSVLIRVVESPDRAWLDMRGLRSISMAT